jgi:hypothetical protein
MYVIGAKYFMTNQHIPTIFKIILETRNSSVEKEQYKLNCHREIFVDLFTTDATVGI